jgi:hypothetical protein
MSKIKDKKQTNASLGYTGNVEIKLVRGKKVIKTIKTHNDGKLPLFNFIANALIGGFDSGGTPRFIILANGASDAVAEQVSTNAIPYSAVSLDSSNTEGNVYASAVFKFLIPFSSISLGTEINIIRLYSQNSTTFGSHIAYFILEEPFESDGKSNVLITWTMKITNQVTNQI